MVTLTVTELNNYVKVLLEKDLYLSGVWVEGEVSNLKVAASGHRYFTLKDKNSAISTVIFKSHGARLKGDLKDGQSILVRGRISLYSATGAYQLYGEEVVFSGLGDLHLQIEALKKAYIEKGYFEAAHKKPLPEMIQKIGVVTSGQGAVIHDIKEVVRKRNPMVDVIIYPVMVQGNEAPLSIKRGIEAFNDYGDVDVLIVGRGGGSLEDLMAFNTEEVVEAIYASRIPVISAVGHETDITLSDFVADVRGATPSQAAELATEAISEKMEWLRKDLLGVFRHLERRKDYAYEKLDHLGNSLLRKRDQVRLLIERNEEKKDALIRGMSNLLEKNRRSLIQLGEKLHILSPLGQLAKGYSIIYGNKGQVVKKVDEVEINDIIKLTVSDGNIQCRVEGKEEKDGN